MTNPTGEQYEISSGDQRAVVTEVGSALRVYAVDGRDVLLGFGAGDVIKGGRGQQLIPWPNRIRDGRYEFGGTTQQLALSEPARHNASHGLARHVPWTVVDHAPEAVTLGVRIFPQPGWPGLLEAEIRHALDSDGLSVTVTARNAGSTDVPFGYGAHPYLTTGEDSVDEVSISAPAASYLTVDDRLLPRSVEPVEGTPFDLRTPAALGDRVFDTAFTDLEHDGDHWVVRLERGDRFAELWGTDDFEWLQVYTGADQRDIGIAVEPMTCGPDAFNAGPTHASMRVLKPGEQFSATWGIRGA